MSFLGEIKRRKVFQVAAVYAVVAWLLVQVADVALPAFEAPTWILPVFILFMILGFPITLVMSWAFNVTPQGLVRDEGSVAQSSGQAIEYLLIGLVIVAVGWLIFRVEFDSANEDERSVLANSIAVLLCDNLSPDPDNAFFAASLHEEILNQLVKLKDLNVIARTSVLQYADAARPIPEIADELKVESVMECSVSYGDGRVAISAQLIDGDTGLHLWSERYNREFKDVFGIQADIAMSVANALEAEFSDEEQARIERPLTTSTEAYEWYLKERNLQVFEEYPDTIPTHIAYLDQAIAVDPDFAAAYAWRSMAQPDAQLSRQSAEKAIQLDPMLGLAHLALAWVESREGDYVEARRAYELALQASPKDAKILAEFARFLAMEGDQLEALQMAEQAIALAPNGYVQFILYGQILTLGRDWVGAASAFRRATEIEPAFAGSFVQLALAELALGNIDEALQNLERTEALWRAPPEWGVSILSYVNGRLGRKDEAEQYARQLESMAVNRAQIPLDAQLNVALGIDDKERARSILTEIVETCPDCSLGHGAARGIRSNWSADPLLNEPEFVNLRNRISVD